MRPTPLAVTVARHNQRRDMRELAEQARRRREELGAHAAPGDRQRLRMIPVIGAPGAMPGTRPDHVIGRRRRGAS